MNKSQRLRRGMVKTMEESGLIRSAPVRDAFLAIGREEFVRDFAKKKGLDAVYEHQHPIPTRFDEAGRSVSSSSAPSIMAIMLEHLDLKLGHRVLEIGAGTGYNAALLKHIVGRRGRVVSVDIDPDIVRDARAHLKRAGYSARVVTADGRNGLDSDEGYDRIIATVSSDHVPRSWFRQVRIGGLVQLPLQLSAATSLPQVVVTFVKTRGGFESVRVTPGGFMGLRDGSSSPSTSVRYLELIERGGGEDDRTLVTLTGEALKRLSDGQKRRLLSIALADERKRSVRPGGKAAGFWAYLALGAPQDRLIAGGWGLIDAQARSFAFFRPRKRGAVIHSSGNDRAERWLCALLDRWTDLGSPDVERLRIRATYGRQPPRAWRTSRRGDGFLSFDWTKTGT